MLKKIQLNFLQRTRSRATYILMYQVFFLQCFFFFLQPKKTHLKQTITMRQQQNSSYIFMYVQIQYLVYYFHDIPKNTGLYPSYLTSNSNTKQTYTVLCNVHLTLLREGIAEVCWQNFIYKNWVCISVKSYIGKKLECKQTCTTQGLKMSHFWPATRCDFVKNCLKMPKVIVVA